jgi:hypothetical protein
MILTLLDIMCTAVIWGLPIAALTVSLYACLEYGNPWLLTVVLTVVSLWLIYGG